MTEKISGIVLAGGMSSRMGTDKGLLKLQNKLLIEYPLVVLQGYCDELLISSNKKHYDHLQLKVVADIHTSIGPMAGLYACLLASKNQHNLFLACDMPFVDNEIMELLLKQKDNYQAIVLSINGWALPVCSYYKKSILGVLEKCIEQGKYSLQHLLKTVNTLVIEIEDPELRAKLLNINTPDEYQKVTTQ